MDTLGPDSYLATAFAGCFEDAEENIKNDFACSMKQRLESAEAKRIEDKFGFYFTGCRILQKAPRYMAAGLWREHVRIELT